MRPFQTGGFVVSLTGPSLPAAIARYRQELLESSVSGFAYTASGWTDGTVAAPDDLAGLLSWWRVLNGLRRPGGSHFRFGEVAELVAAGQCPDHAVAGTMNDARREFALVGSQATLSRIGNV